VVDLLEARVGQVAPAVVVLEDLAVPVAQEVRADAFLEMARLVASAAITIAGLQKARVRRRAHALISFRQKCGLAIVW
jgi:hypothetical protein